MHIDAAVSPTHTNANMELAENGCQTHSVTKFSKITYTNQRKETPGHSSQVLSSK
jgi:hypothetical protein